MAYEIEEIRTSQEIFYYLLEHHEIHEETEHRLYRLMQKMNRFKIW